MGSLFARRAFGAAIALGILTGCGSSGTGAPSAALGLQGGASRIGSDKSSSNFSGKYSGKFKDIAYGTGKATASYAQAQDGLGGILTVKYANATITASVALIASASGINGTSVAGSGSLYCTLATTGTYDAKTRTITGSYKAVYGCTGDSGTFTLKHQCYYKGNGSENVDVRPDTLPHPC